MSGDNALLLVGQALGVIDEMGEPQGEFFGAPLATIQRTLADRFRRERLVEALDLLLERDPGQEDGPEDSSRRYRLIPAGLRGRLTLVAVRRAETAVTFAIEAQFPVGPQTDVRLEVPLLSAEGDGADPVMVAGTPDGRIRVRMTHTIVAATVVLSAAAWAEAGAPRGSFGVRVSGLTRGGTAVPDLDFSTEQLAGGAVDAIVSILRLVLDASGATVTPVVALLADHLPGVLGLDSSPVPLADLAQDPDALRSWLARLTADTEVFRAWFGHLAGLLGDETPASSTAPTGQDPWTLALTAADSSPRVELRMWLAEDTATYLSLELLARFEGEAPSLAALDASVELLRLPLTGAGPVVILQTGALVVRGRSDGSDLIDTDDLGIGSLAGGIRWSSEGIRPVLEVRRVRLPGTSAVLPQLDLTDANALADTVKAEAREFLKRRLGAPGRLEDALLALTGLDGIAPPLDLTLLTTAPTRALADYHRRCVLDGVWADRQFRALGTLLGVDAATPVEPSGTPPDAWRLRVFGADEAGMELVASAAVEGERVTLEVGLAFFLTAQVPESAAAFKFGTRIGVVSFLFEPGGITTMRLLPAIAASWTIGGLLPEDLPLRCQGWTGRLLWRPGRPVEVENELTGLALTVPETLELGTLALPPQPDLTRLDLGLGLDTDAVRSLLTFLAGRALAGFRPEDDPVPDLLTSVIAAVIRALPEDLSNPVAVLRDLTADPFRVEGPLGPLMPELCDLLSSLLTGTDGAGTAQAPWTLPLGDLSAVGWFSRDEPDTGGPNLDLYDRLALTDRILELDALLADGDGLVVTDPDRPFDLTVPCAHADVIADPLAVRAIMERLDEWKAAEPDAPTVIVLPGLLGTRTLGPLLEALAAEPQLVDLNRVAGGPDPLDLSRYRAAPVHVVVLDDRKTAQIDTVLTRLRELHPGRKFTAIGVSLAAPALLAAVRAKPDAYTGVICVASPADGLPAPVNDTVLASTVHLLNGFSLPDGQHSRALKLIGGLLAGWTVDATGGRAPLTTPLELLAAEPFVPDDGFGPALRIGGVCGSGLADLAGQLMLGEPVGLPRAFVGGLEADLLSSASTAVRATARLDLAAFGPAPTGLPALTVHLRIGKPDTPLVGPASPGREVQIGAIDLHLVMDLRSRTAEARLTLLDVMVRGAHHPRLTRDDAPFSDCLYQAVRAVSDLALAGDTALAESLALLRDGLGIVRRLPSGEHRVLDDALAALLDDPAAWLTDRLAALLDTQILGLHPDTSAPAGRRRWVRGGPDEPVRITLTSQPWTVLVEATAPAGPITVNGRWTVVVGESIDLDVGVGAGPLSITRRADGTLVVDGPQPGGTAVLSQAGGPPEPGALERLATPIGAMLAAHLVGVLAGLTGAERRALADLLLDPAASLHRLLGAAPQVLPELLAQAAALLGLETSAAGVSLIPGLLALDGGPVDGRPALTLSTPQELRPLPEIGLSVSTMITVDEARHVHPGLRAQLRISPPGWPSFGVRLTLTAAGPRIELDLDGGAWFEVVPHFVGLGALTGPLLDRLLPRTLDAIVDHTPNGALKTAALEVARALDVYGTGFGDGARKLAELTPDHVASRAANLVAPAVSLLETLIGATLPPGTITPAGQGVRLRLPALLGGELSLTAAFAPFAATIGVHGIEAGPVVADVEFTGSVSAPVFAGSVRVGLDLREAIGLADRPTLSLAVAESTPLTISFDPLGTANTADVSVEFTPEQRFTATPAGTAMLVERLAVLPGLHAAVALLGPALDEQIIPSQAVTLRSLLVGAGLLCADGSRVVTRLPTPIDLLAGAGSVLVEHLHADLSPTLRLGFGDADGLGPQLRGDLPFTVGTTRLRLLLGGPAAEDDPLAIDVLRPSGGRWDLLPRLRVNRTGVDASGPPGSDLIATDFVRIGRLGAHAGFDVTVDLSGSAPVFDVSQWAVGVVLGGISLPAMSGGGDSNPVAAGLLASAEGEPIQPQFDLDIGWDGRLLIRVRGTDPGKPIWFPVDRGFGPLYIARVGVETGTDDFAGERLDFVGLLVEGALNLAGLSISAEGLSVWVPPKYVTRPQRWAFDLSGLAVSYEGSGVSIAGGLLKEGSGATTQYLGMLEVNVSGRGLSALGGYTRLEDGAPSLFAFVVVNTPIGGPPYLFVTGLAGGFGFNRRLLVPSNPEQVPKFPLMAALSGRPAGDPSTPEGATTMMQDMARSIPRERDTVWLAAGVKFTTFVLLETNAIVYVQFGNDFEIGLLGLTRARLPSADTTLAAVELAMLARYSTTDNTLLVRAQLTANSWLFTKDCRLTGGFAFVIWFDRPQALVTLGGYHPDHQPPGHYPEVPRVGFRWAPAKGVTVKGESYFAITPEAAMVGGRLEVRAEVDGVGHGELTLWLDALVWFDPARFMFDFGVRVSGKAFGIGFNVGASVHVDLPPVYVLVHVDVLWGFDIEFGQRKLPPPLDFPAFCAKFLGAGEEVCGLVIAAGPSAGQAGTTGSRRPGASKDDPLRVLPEFELLTTSKLPAVGAAWAGQPVPGPGPDADGFHLIPLGPGSAQYRPVHRVTAVRMSDGTDLGAQLAASSELNGVPSALYWDSKRGSVPSQSEMRVNYSDMVQFIGGVRLRSAAEIMNSPGTSPINVADIIDELPVLELPELPAFTLRPRAAPAGPAHPERAAPTEEPAGPRPKWGRTAVSRSLDAAAPAKVGVDRLQLWTVPDSGWNVAGERLHLRQFDAVGRLIRVDRLEAGEQAVEAATRSVAVQPLPATGLSGWRLHTLAHPVAPAAFATATCGVAFAQPVIYPVRLAPGEGVEMFTLVAEACAVITDLPPETARVVVLLDRLVEGADPRRSAVVACEQSGLRLVRQTDTVGRTCLVYEVTGIDDGATRLSVTVAVPRAPDTPPAWLGGGGVGGPAADVEAAMDGDLWTPFPDPEADADPAVLRFTRTEPSHG